MHVFRPRRSYRKGSADDVHTPYPRGFERSILILPHGFCTHVSDTFSHLLTIHHSTQNCAENRCINLSLFLDIFEYQHFRLRCCIKSHYAKPPRIGLRYLPQNTNSTTFCPTILYVSDTFPRLQTGYHSTPMFQTSSTTLPETPLKTPSRG